MKKFFSFLIFVISIFAVSNVSAAVIGEVLYTDIGTLIDDNPIKSYNINDYTYVVAEDLVKYGFDVVWDGEKRTLSIYHNVHKGYEIALNKEEINIKKSSVPMRKHYCNVYSTDIKTYLDGKEIEAFNVDGRTMIQVDNLVQYGEFYYNDEKRMVELRIMKPSFEYGIKIAEGKVEKTVGINPPRYREEVEYVGVADEEGEPFGIGKMTSLDKSLIRWAYWDDYTERDTYYNEIYGEEKIERTYGYRDKASGKDTVITVYGSGAEPYTMNCTKRYEQDAKFIRNGVYDRSYLYGFYITEEKYFDSDGAEINYTGGESAKFSEVMSDRRFAQISYVKTYDGKVYAAGFSGATEDTGWESTGNPYKVFTKTEVLDFPESPTKPKLISVQYAAADAGAYNRIISLNSKGAVYFERTDGIWAELCREQSDYLDLSSPVKVFDKAKYVNIQLEDAGEVTGYAYIPYFYVVDEENNLWHWNYEYLHQSKKGNEYDENNGYIAYGRVEYIKEPMKIADNVKKAFGTEEKYLFKTDGSVVRLTSSGEELVLDDVLDIDADMYGQNFIAVKTDGTLWTWGKNQNGQCGVGHTDYVLNPTQITQVYERK